MYNDKVIKALKSFDVYYKNENIKFSELEKRLFEVFMYEDKNTNLYITPKDNKYFLVLFIIYSGLIQYLENIHSKGNNLIDEIKEGDILEFSKAKCEFIGRVENTIKLKFADNLIYTIPIEQLYKVSAYKGNAKKLNKYPSNINRGAKKTRNIISQILDIDNDAFSKIIKKSTLIVASKNSIFSIVDNLKIKFNDELLDIGEVFPMAYCFSEDNYYYFRGNASKQEPIIKYTSKIYNAKEIVRKNKKINSVIILQDKLNNEDIEDIIYISKKSNIIKTRLMLQQLSIEKHIDNENIKNKFNIININEEFYRGILNYVHDSIKRNQYQLLRNYINSTETYLSVKNQNFDKHKKKIFLKCRNLINKFEDNNNIIKFVINARTIVKRLYSMIMPLLEYESYYINKNLKHFTIKFLLKELEEFYKNDFVDSLSNMAKLEVEDIFNECKNLYEEIYKSNPKWIQLQDEIRFLKNEKVAIIVENKNIKNALRKYLNKKYPLYNITVETLSTIKEDIFNSIIYTSKLDDNYYWNYKCFNSSNHKYILFKSEKANIKYLKKRYFKFIGEDYEFDNEKIEFYEDRKDNVNDELEVIGEIQLNNSLESLIATKYLPINESMFKHQSLIKCEFVLTFQTGEKAFLTSQYEAYVLNESKEELINKKSSKIEKGDILLFVEDIGKDLIEKVMLDLLEIDELKERYSDSYQLVNQWKNELKNYITINNIKYTELEKKMKKYGISRCGGTIRSWLVNSTVGPQDKEVLKALGEISGIDILLNNYGKCYDACSSIRRFQISIRKAIAKYILKSSINEEDEALDILIANRIGKSISYIKKVEVKNIYAINKEIPLCLTNRVIEE